jgi:hypothetical protein
VPGVAVAHLGQQIEDQLHWPEVVDLHRPLVVVEAVIRAADRAADRPPGVVDQHIDLSVLLEHLRRHPIDVVGVRQIGGVHECGATDALDLLLGLDQLVLAARHQQHRAAGSADLQRRGLADPARGAGDHHVTAVDRVAQRLGEHATGAWNPLAERA